MIRHYSPFLRVSWPTETFFQVHTAPHQTQSTAIPLIIWLPRLPIPFARADVSSNFSQDAFGQDADKNIPESPQEVFKASVLACCKLAKENNQGFQMISTVPKDEYFICTCVCVTDDFLNKSVVLPFALLTCPLKKVTAVTKLSRISKVTSTSRSRVAS